MAQFLEDSFPELKGNITGGNIPPPPWVSLLQNALAVFQFGFMAFCVMGDSVWNYIPLVSAPPLWYWDAKKYGMQFGILAFLIAPQVTNSFVVSNAFEVILDGTTTVFSKIDTGRLPGAKDLIGPLINAGLAQAASAAQ